MSSGVKLRAMKLVTKLIASLRPAPKTPEEIETEQEAEQIRDEMNTVRLSTRSLAGTNYQTERASKDQEL
jgi:hypothetical protein